MQFAEARIMKKRHREFRRHRVAIEQKFF